MKNIRKNYTDNVVLVGMIVTFHSEFFIKPWSFFHSALILNTYILNFWSMLPSLKQVEKELYAVIFFSNSLHVSELKSRFNGGRKW